MPHLDKLEPVSVFRYFEAISEIPRGSGHEKSISDSIVNFAKKKGLRYSQDEAYNVVVYKDGTPGYEHLPAVIIQGHMDMVCEKNRDTEHDFLTEGLKLQVDGDFLSAEGTTLGADNGIAVAYALALLDAEDIPHPPIEALFTTDEEVGMKGANVFDADKLQGKYLVNIDTEEEGTFVVSCCGGLKATVELPVRRQPAPSGYEAFLLKIKGLKGGHSGTEIHLQRPNANKLMGRLLGAINEKFDIYAASLNGGLMDNAISREAEAVILVEKKDLEAVKGKAAQMEAVFLNEYRGSDRGIQIILEPLAEKVEKVFDKETLKKAIAVLLLIPYGVVTVSLEIQNLVESSSNIGIVKTGENGISFTSAVRSSVECRKQSIFRQIAQIAELTGAAVDVRGEYPSWEFNPDSGLLVLCRDVYEEMFGKEAKAESIHAGLECGIFSGKKKDLDIISFGPDIFDAHTPDERLSISSTARMWDFLKELLKRMK